jgi:hypothetical protein
MVLADLIISWSAHPNSCVFCLVFYFLFVRFNKSTANFLLAQHFCFKFFIGPENSGEFKLYFSLAKYHFGSEVIAKRSCIFKTPYYTRYLTTTGCIYSSMLNQFNFLTNKQGPPYQPISVEIVHEPGFQITSTQVTDS